MAKEEATDKKEEQKNKKEKRPQAQKRDIQSEKRRLRNKSFTSSVRTVIRGFDESLVKGDQKASKERLNEVYSMMDKGVKRGIIKINKASRTKARLAARFAAKA